MAKKNTAFFCNNCGCESSRWLGQCPACKEWNTLVEERITVKKDSANKAGASYDVAKARPEILCLVSGEEKARLSTGFSELDRVLGGGIVPGSLVLVGGDPGIGKSTLLLQLCRNLAYNSEILYVTGEESLAQIKLRADRLGAFSEGLKVLCETSLDEVAQLVSQSLPSVVVIDSIQTMHCEEIGSSAGSVSQVREAAATLMRLAKGLGVTVFIIGHVTKDGAVAGPKVLEHMVDTVLYFEGDSQAAYRILRSVKNRFGSTNEIGVFEMRSVGLVEVANPSEYMLSGRPQGANGSAVVCLIEGTRPLLVEIQALVCQTSFGIPRRQATGCDLNRVNLLMAVLEKRLNLSLASCDAYINLAGGLKITEPALDLGIAAAIVSSFKNRPVDERTVFFGEVGLSGEVRNVSMPNMRVKEAAKLGFSSCVLPAASAEALASEREGIELVGVKTVREAIELI